MFDDEAQALRFAPSLFHWPSQQRFPAMIAWVKAADGRVITVHQTFLEAGGRGKIAGDKAKLFPKGVNPLGGGVWFGAIDSERELVVGEGIESTLSAMRLLELDAGCAALSAAGLRALALPKAVRRVAIFADHDQKGQGLEAAHAARLRWAIEGREVRVLLPDAPGDANDILRRRAHE